MTSLISLGTVKSLDVLSADFKRRVQARRFAEPRVFEKMADQVLIDHPILRALVLPAGTTIDGDVRLDEAELHDQRIGAVAVEGDLVIRGRLLNEDSEGGPFLLVDGALQARQIVLGGASVMILGSVDSEGIVFCDYNHGLVLVGGDVKAPAVITNDHMIEVAGSIKGLVIGDDEGNMRDMLVGDVFEDPDDPDDQWPLGDVIRERLAAGLPVLKNGL